MRKLIAALGAILAAALLAVQPAAAHDAGPAMDAARLTDLIAELGDDVLINGNVVQFSYLGARLLCVFDSAADRMRIIAPIVELGDIPAAELPEQLTISMMANFHSVLDARYAISDNVLYAAFIHPLGALGEEELRSALRQVATAHNTFGEQYTSGGLFFGGD